MNIKDRKLIEKYALKNCLDNPCLSENIEYKSDSVRKKYYSTLIKNSDNIEVLDHLYFNDLDDLIEFCIEYQGEAIGVNCDIVLNEENIEYKCYYVDVSNRNLTFNSEEARLDYLIDTLGTKNYLNLYNIEVSE